MLNSVFSWRNFLSYGLLSLFVRTVTIVFGSGPYSLLQWTVRSAVVKHTDYCRSL